MELNIYILREIMNVDTDDTSEALSNLNGFALMRKYVGVQLINDKDNNLSYQANVSDILESEISIEELITLRQSGWELSEDEKIFFKHLA